MRQRKPGWYPDPADGNFLRQWDGSAWVEGRKPNSFGAYSLNAKAKKIAPVAVALFFLLLMTSSMFAFPAQRPDMSFLDSYTNLYRDVTKNFYGTTIIPGVLAGAALVLNKMKQLPRLLEFGCWLAVLFGIFTLVNVFSFPEYQGFYATFAEWLKGFGISLP